MPETLRAAAGYSDDSNGGDRRQSQRPWWSYLAELALKPGPAWVMVGFLIYWLTWSFGSKLDAHIADMARLITSLQDEAKAQDADRQTQIQLQDLSCTYVAKTNDERSLCNAVVREAQTGSGGS